MGTDGPPCHVFWVGPVFPVRRVFQDSAGHNFNTRLENVFVIGQVRSWSWDCDFWQVKTGLLAMGKPNVT